MQDNSKFVEPYITYTLKDNALNIKENDVAFIPYGQARKNPNEDIPYEAIKAIYLKKELSQSADKQAKKSDIFYAYLCEIHFHHKAKITIKNSFIKNNQEIIKNDEYERFIRELIEKLINFPDVNIYAYEGMGTKFLGKVNKVFPVVMIGGTIITGLAITKILFKALVLVASIGFDIDFIYVGISTFILLTGWTANYYFKKNAEVIKSAIPAHFFPSFENEQKLLEK
jgi:hypothetical protein